MWQHDLETHDGITTRPLWYHLKEVAQRKLCVEGNGPVKGATMGFQKFSIKPPYASFMYSMLNLDEPIKP